MAHDPLDNDPAGRDEREAELSRRSNTPAVSPWLVIGAVVLVGAIVYVASALLV